MSDRHEAPLTDEDLVGFLSAHASMRCEFGRLALVAATASDPGHIALIEEQITLTTNCLHHHHTSEDTELWPRLRTRAPQRRADLDELEAEHAVVDPLIEQIRDTSLPLGVRAEVLAELQAVLEEHLDHEEAVALPLVCSHLARSEWEALGKRVIEETPREVLPLMLGMCASAIDEQRRAALLAQMPPPARDLFEQVWWPSYEQRFAALYGAEAPAVQAA
jgi:hypothetical protein